MIGSIQTFFFLDLLFRSDGIRDSDGILPPCDFPFSNL
jgi:hypothetical protein